MLSNLVIKFLQEKWVKKTGPGVGGDKWNRLEHSWCAMNEALWIIGKPGVFHLTFCREVELKKGQTNRPHTIFDKTSPWKNCLYLSVSFY